MIASEEILMLSSPFRMTKPRMVGMGETPKGIVIAAAEFDLLPSMMVVLRVGSPESKAAAVRLTDLLSVRFSE
jgi:hypothetical protein